mmetsp:Transcript_57841/g.163244  ORF Transcript_57841/g.163244 Transcript_57841/m.163244 type:complete len:259 (+) Transcript_57841:144-920(+)
MRSTRRLVRESAVCAVRARRHIAWRRVARRRAATRRRRHPVARRRHLEVVAGPPPHARLLVRLDLPPRLAEAGDELVDAPEEGAQRRREGRDVAEAVVERRRGLAVVTHGARRLLAGLACGPVDLGRHQERRVPDPLQLLHHGEARRDVRRRALRGVPRVAGERLGLVDGRGVRVGARARVGRGVLAEGPQRHRLAAHQASCHKPAPSTERAGPVLARFRDRSLPGRLELGQARCRGCFVAKRPGTVRLRSRNRLLTR